MFQKADDYVLSLFTKFCHWSQRTFGLDNFFWGKIFCLMFLGTTYVGIGSHFRHIIFAQALMGVLLWTFIARFFWWLRKQIYSTLENHYVQGNTVAHGVTLVFRNYLQRMMMIMISCLMASSPGMDDPRDIIFLHILRSVLAFQIVTETYFLGIIPLPPGKSKVEEWKESFAAGFKKMTPIGNR